MDVTRLSKRDKLTVHQAVGLFVLVELHFLGQRLTPFDLELLTLLVQAGQAVSLPDFCDSAARALYPDCEPEDLATRKQNVRNRLVKLTARQLVVKSYVESRTFITPISSLAVPLDKPLHLDYQFLGSASN